MPPTALVIRYFSKRMRRLSRSVQDSIGDITRVVQEPGNKNIWRRGLRGTPFPEAE